MKSIFNSLGSNYSFSYVLLALKQVFFNETKSIDNLLKYLNRTYSGKPFIFYKGRDAIEFSLRVLFNEEVKVLTQAFSCFAIEEGIKRAGATPVYVDIAKNSTNLSVETLEVEFAKNKDVKAVLVQHGLGIPADIIEIKKWCHKNGLLLIEDLAQAIGGVDKLEQPLGKNSDVIIFSFGRDKIIDAVSGGGVVFKSLNTDQDSRAEIIMENEVGDLPKNILDKDMFYSLITFFGRKTHDFVIGKIIFKFARALRLITSPTISKLNKLTKMSPAYATLAFNSLSKLDRQILNRRKIANFYFEKLVTKRGIASKNISKIKIINTRDDIDRGSNLRFSIRVKNVNKLIKLMKKNKIYLSDRWYRSAVDCGKQFCESTYKIGQAPNAEKLASEVFNLPTHQGITLEKANRIIEVLNKF